VGGENGQKPGNVSGEDWDGGVQGPMGGGVPGDGGGSGEAATAQCRPQTMTPPSASCEGLLFPLFSSFSPSSFPPLLLFSVTWKEIISCWEAVLLFNPCQEFKAFCHCLCKPSSLSEGSLPLFDPAPAPSFPPCA